MADRVLFIGWDRVVPGREKQAIDLFQKSMQLYTKIQFEGGFESFDVILLDAHGGDLNGFSIIKGNADNIAEVRKNITWIEYMVEAGYCLEGVGAVDGYIGEGINVTMTLYMKLIS
jgi:hypothetical protein